MRRSLWPYHVSNGTIAALVVLGGISSRSILWPGSLLLAIALPVGWVWLAVKRRRLATERTPARHIYAASSIALSALAWMAAACWLAFFALLTAAFRPHSKSVEVLEQPGLGTIENRTQIVPEFGDGDIRRNAYYFVDPLTRSAQEIGRQDGELGMFAHAPNTQFFGHEGRLEFVVGAFVATRAPGESRWRTRHIGSNDEQKVLRELFPPLQCIEEQTAGKAVWEYPLPWLSRPVVESYEPAANRLVATCQFGARSITLVYTRLDVDSHWELDRAALAQRNEQPPREPLPDGVRADIRVVAVASGARLVETPPLYDDFEALMATGKATERIRAGAVLPDGGAASLPFGLATGDGASLSQVVHVRAAWRSGESFVVYLSDFVEDLALLRAQPPERWVRVRHIQYEGRSYLTFLRLGLE